MLASPWPAASRVDEETCAGSPSLSSSRRRLAQPKALDFAGLGLRQRLNKLDRTRIFERRDRRFDVILQTFVVVCARRHAVLEHNMGLDDLPALLIGHPDHRAFLDIRMR